MTDTYPMDWAYAYGRPTAIGLFRREPEDFIVDEDLGFELSGSGEHVYLQLQKRGDNTSWLARQIARLAEVETKDIGYAGLKDRHAVTRQWFSVYLPKGEEPDWQALNTDSIQVLQVTRHHKKLRRGEHRSNHFQIRLHELEGDVQGLAERFERVNAQGVPNYFGEQRFGNQGGNLLEAQRILVDGGRIGNRQKRGLILSAARSYLFNQVLSRRVQDECWCGPIDGDVDGQPSGPLWGRGRLLSQGQCLQLEESVLEPLASWMEGLEHVGLKQERRGLALMPQGFTAAVDGRSLELSFALPPGTYATAILREICELQSALCYSPTP